MISRKEKEYGTYIHPLVQPNTAIRKLQRGVGIRALVTKPASLVILIRSKSGVLRTFLREE
jgi:hypothetical protein